MKIYTTQASGEDWNRSHQLLKRLDMIGDSSVKHFAENFLSADTIPNPFTIELETYNRCNNDCPFCPVNRNNDTRKAHFMDEKLFYSIIDQLKDFSGVISLFSNNEPLLDKRIFKFIEYAKNNLPHARHALFTNGLLLDREKFLLLTKNLDSLVIDNYDDNFQVMPNLKKILESNLPQDIHCDVNISMRKKNQKLNTRGSKAPNRLNEEKYHSCSACVLPFSQMIIRPNGTLAKCCNDPLDDMILGDLNKQTLREAWTGKTYMEFRKAMYYGERANIKGCDYCDIFGLYNYLPKSAKSREHLRLAKEIAFRKKFGKVYLFDTTPISKNIYSILDITTGGAYSTELSTSETNRPKKISILSHLNKLYLREHL